MTTLEIPFPTSDSPINSESLGRQNKSLIDYLWEEGNTIHFGHPKVYELKIGVLHSRAADVRKYLRENYEVLKAVLKDKMIRVNNSNCKLYWIERN